MKRNTKTHKVQEMQLADCHPVFRGKIHNIAMAAGKDDEAVYRLWRQYSQRCFDQSALLSEFVSEAKAELGGDLQLLSQAVK